MALDHPGWLTDEHGRARRAFHTGDTVWAITHAPGDATFKPIVEIIQSSTSITYPVVDWFDLTVLPADFDGAQQVRDGVHIGRVRSPSLWDALIPPILRQRRSARAAVQQYRSLCIEHGRVISTSAGPALLPPAPEIVVTFPDEVFNELGLRGKQQHLRTAAEAYLKHADHWATLSPTDLYTDLQNITYIGAATASAAVADTTNDHSFTTIHPHIAYRYWQKLVTPPRQPPTPDEFTNAWMNLGREQRSALTVLIRTATRDM
jgi:DNA-3-methyladenine glycosylase II